MANGAKNYCSWSVRPVVAGLLCVACFVLGILAPDGRRSHIEATNALDISLRMKRKGQHALNAAFLPAPVEDLGAGLHERCDATELAYQAQQIKMVAKGVTSLQCPTFNYMPDLRSYLDKEVVMFDIGCNNAFDSAMFFEAFVPEDKFNRRALGQFYQSNPVTNRELTTGPYGWGTCSGACNDCKQSFWDDGKQPAGDGRHVQVHCFEPSASNNYVISLAQSHFFDAFNTSNAGNKFYLHRNAFSNTSGTVYMPDKCGQLCQMQSNTSVSASDPNMVPLTTVDEMMEQLKLDQLFMLKIDTEGHDPLVLQGARKTLAAHKATVVLFEYNSMGPWATYPFMLKDVVADLEDLGYICYFEGNLLTRITGCWTDAFEFKYWSNIVCVASGKPAQAVLRAYSAVPFRHRCVEGC